MPAMKWAELLHNGNSFYSTYTKTVLFKKSHLRYLIAAIRHISDTAELVAPILTNTPNVILWYFSDININKHYVQDQ